MKKTYSPKMLMGIFSAMGRDYDIKIYYNKMSDGIEQDVQGYLSNYFDDMNSRENEIIYNRIRNHDRSDEIIKGKHFLIPRLPVSEFLKNLKQAAKKYNHSVFITQWRTVQYDSEIEKFILKIENIITQEFNEGVSKLAFGGRIRDLFFEEMYAWQQSTGFEKDALDKIIELTIHDTALNFLKAANSETHT